MEIGSEDQARDGGGGAAEPAGVSRKTWLRLAMLVVVSLALFVWANQLGLLVDKRATLERIRGVVGTYGAWGFVVFVALYFVGELMHIPGIVFFAAGVLIWGKAIGAMAGYVGALASCFGVFVLVRRIGGQPLREVKIGWVRNLLTRLDRNPVFITMVLRMFLGNAPQLNYALALSNVNLRNYMFGSCFGLVLPICVQTLLMDMFMRAF